MKDLEFPLLTKDDIELRIGQMSKDGTKATLLLYQDARCGMKYLDQVVGANNWQKRYYEVRGLVLCSLGINVNYDEPNKEPLWVWKDDTGTAGSIEEEKSIISDSFKRACVCVGLARELYTAPTIWVKVESKYDKFKVASISYNENREIKTLEIANDKGEIVYTYGMRRNQPSEPKPQKRDVLEEATQGIADSFLEESEITQETKDKISAITGKYGAEKYSNFKLYLAKTFGVESIGDLSEKQGQKLLNVLGGK